MTVLHDAWTEIYEVLERNGVNIRDASRVAEVLSDLVRHVEWGTPGGIKAALSGISSTTRGSHNLVNPTFDQRISDKYNKPTSCECGGEKTKMPHLHWCLKYSEGS